MNRCRPRNPPLSYRHFLIRARLSSQGPVVRQGLAVANTPITIAE
jgi:hypothetical protein